IFAISDLPSSCVFACFVVRLCVGRLLKSAAIYTAQGAVMPTIPYFYFFVTVLSLLFIIGHRQFGVLFI
ncbi:hypothetical protein BVRB_025350, partial [Beta vulgaris subsp. vulgaris]